MKCLASRRRARPKPGKVRRIGQDSIRPQLDAFPRTVRMRRIQCIRNCSERSSSSPAAPANTHLKSVCYTGIASGPRVIITGAVHGNETCGTIAIGRVIDDLEQQRLTIVSGAVTFVPITNPLAYAKRDRAGDRNLNRNLYPVAQPPASWRAADRPAGVQ